MTTRSPSSATARRQRGFGLQRLRAPVVGAGLRAGGVGPKHERAQRTAPERGRHAGAGLRARCLRQHFHRRRRRRLCAGRPGPCLHERGDLPSAMPGRPARALRSARTESTTTTTGSSTTRPTRGATSRTTTRKNGGTYADGVSCRDLLLHPPHRRRERRAQGGTAGTPFPNQAVNINAGYLGANNVRVQRHRDRRLVERLLRDGSRRGRSGRRGIRKRVRVQLRRAAQYARSAIGSVRSGVPPPTSTGSPKSTTRRGSSRSGIPTQRPCLIPEPHLLAPTALPREPDRPSRIARRSPRLGSTPSRCSPWRRRSYDIQSNARRSGPATCSRSTGTCSRTRARRPRALPPRAPRAPLSHGTLFGPAYAEPAGLHAHSRRDQLRPRRLRQGRPHERGRARVRERLRRRTRVQRVLELRVRESSSISSPRR